MDEQGRVHLRCAGWKPMSRAGWWMAFALLPHLAFAQTGLGTAATAAQPAAQGPEPAPPAVVPATGVGAPAPAAAPPTEAAGCHPSAGEDLALLDRAQLAVYRSMCTTATWFDGFFGESNELPPGEDVAGRIGLSTVWDQRDGLRPRLRLRARLPLPAFENRLRLVFGRDDQRQLIQDRRLGASDTLPTSFRDVRDTAWLLGLGYSAAEGLGRGLDFGVGVRLRFPPDPFAKTAYHYGVALGADNVVNLRETLFWQNSRGFGETSQIDIDHLISDKFLLRWSNSGTYAEDTKGLGWYSALALYQDLGERRSLAYTTFAQGETRAEVALEDYGLQVRYRQSVLRKWLFVEMSTSVTWPRALLTESRTANFGFGLGVEMYFGKVADEDLR